MALRWLIYRTDYGNTIVRENPTDNSTGGTEQAFQTTFIIPEIQPLYLWRFPGSGVDAVPNTDQNIRDWLGHIAPPPEPDDNATVGYVTGITENKIDKVTGATGNLGTFLADGNLEDSGYSITDITGSSSGVSYNVFNAYTGATEIRLTDIEDDITFLSGATDEKIDKVTGATGQVPVFTTDGNIEDSGYTIADLTGSTSGVSQSDFDSYTGATQPIIDGALTGVTNLGTGTTLGGVAGRDVTIKSISVLGGLNLSGDANNIIISGGSLSSVAWGDVTGTLSNQTDLWNVLTGKTDVSVFNTYTGATETRLTDIEDDVTFLSGQTDLKLNISDFNVYSGLTNTRITDVEDDITILYNESLVNITGATNGLSKSGNKLVKLGGTLTEDTTISGTTYDFTLNVADIIIQSAGVNGIDIIDAGAGNVDIESDGGSINLIGNTALGVPTTKLEISETTMKITDSRGTPVGLEYAADYSTSFTDESLVTKRYVDSVAAGLTPKASVDVASTANINLATGGLLTIDGLTLSSGDRVLVKDQTDASQNGIYSATTGAWGRTFDFDGNPDGEVVDGNIIPVVTGDTQYNTLWVLVTPDPITVGTTDLEFTLFSSPVGLVAGNGIDISGNAISVDGQTLAGNSISWSGDTFNVDVNSGTLSTALDNKLDVSDFNTYSGLTNTRITDIENDVLYLSGQTDLKLNISDFNTYSGLTNTRITDNENDIIYLSGQTGNKLDVDVFTGYTATTDTRLDGIDDDITYISGITDTKLDESIFTGYTATTVTNEIFLTHTGGTNLNTIAVTAINWDVVEVSGTSYLWSGGCDIFIKESGDYEISYNIPFNSETNSSITIGANLVKNNSVVINLTAAADGGITNIGTAGSIGISPVILTLELNDKLTLGTFRTESSGVVNSSLTGNIFIKKKIN